MRKEETDRFVAAAENGQQCTIVELTTMIPRRGLSGGADLPGAREYVTANGRHINPLSDGNFEDVLSGVVFRRIED